jgi:adenylate kinase
VEKAGPRYIFLGPPGAGKGTQANFASEWLGVPAIATGKIFRDAIAQETAMGKQIAQFVNSGLLVPDKLTDAIVAERLKEKDCRKGFILDGYPRNLAQAKTLDQFLQKSHAPLGGVLYFKVDAAVVVERMGKRRICAQCGQTYNLVSQPPQQEGRCDRCGGTLVMRSDDQPDAIRKRLEVYEETTSPLLQYYEKKGILHVLSGSLSVPEVTAQVKAVCLGKAEAA